jgi:hypothetical protein
VKHTSKTVTVMPDPFGPAFDTFIAKGMKKVKDITLSGFYDDAPMLNPKAGTRIIMTIPLSDTHDLRVYGKVTSKRRVRR